MGVLSTGDEEWRGHKWQLVTDGSVRVWSSEGAGADPAYGETVSRVRSVLPEQVDRIVQVLSWLEARAVDVAVFPRDQYLENVGLDPEKLSWVECCIRDGVLCCRPEFLGTGTSPVGVTHELLHSLLAGDVPRPVAIEEGLVEAIPRLVMHMPDATSARFLREITEAQLLTVAEIDQEGTMRRSQNPPNTNVSYVSAMCFVVGLARELTGDLVSGIQRIYDATIPPDCYASLARAMRLEQSEIVDGLFLQKRGLAFVQSGLPSAP